MSWQRILLIACAIWGFSFLRKLVRERKTERPDLPPENSTPECDGEGITSVGDITIDSMMEAYSLDAVDYARDRFGIELDFSAESIERVESILGQLHDSIPRGIKGFFTGPSQKDIMLMVKMLGSYVGEVMRHEYGGEWVMTAPTTEIQHLMLEFDEHQCWPLVKVYKRIVDGPEDNVLHYFSLIPSLSDQVTREREMSTDIHDGVT